MNAARTERAEPLRVIACRLIWLRLLFGESQPYHAAGGVVKAATGRAPRRRGAAQPRLRPKARLSCALVIFERPSMPSCLARL